MPMEYTDEFVRQELKARGFTGPEEPIEVARQRLADYMEFHWHSPIEGWEVRTGKPCDKMPAHDARALVVRYPWVLGVSPGLRWRLEQSGSPDPSKAISPPPVLGERRWVAPNPLEEALRIEGRMRRVPETPGDRRSGNTTAACNAVADLVEGGETEVVVRLPEFAWTRHVIPMLLDVLERRGVVASRAAKTAVQTRGCQIRFVGPADAGRWTLGFRGKAIEVTG